MIHAEYDCNNIFKEGGMRWIETIRIQSATGKAQNTQNELAVIANEIQKSSDYQGLWVASVSNHALLPGYFALRLFWDTDDPKPSGSLLGSSLAQNLKVFGLVDHSVWIETHLNKGGVKNVQ